MSETPERRSVAVHPLSARQASERDTLVLSGWAALTNCAYEVGGAFTETLAPGCFRRSLGENPDVVLLLGHGNAGAGLPLARTSAGTLTLREDSRGLYFEASLDPEDPDSVMLGRKLARRDLDGQCSFAFTATDQEWSDDYARRLLKSVSLHKGDVSVVVHGANDRTSATIAPRSASRTSARELPDFTRRARVDLDRLRLRELQTRRTR